MADPILSIGGVQFQVIEQPDSLPLGGKQSLVINELPGGNLNVQELGAYDDKQQLKGTFWYEGALSRAQALDDMRVQGKEVLLQFGDITRYVIIEQFNYDVYNSEWVDYTMTLQPSRPSGTDIPAGATPLQDPPSLEQLVTTAPDLTTSVSDNGQASSAASSSPSQAVQYTVKDGDTLFGIAYQFYGDGQRFTDIAQANNIDNPNLIITGQVLTIPQ